MDILIAIIVSSVLSSIITLYIQNRKTKHGGTLVIDRSEPDEPPMPFIEIYSGVGGIEGIAAQKYITLSVENRNYASHD